MSDGMKLMIFFVAAAVATCSIAAVSARYGKGTPVTAMRTISRTTRCAALKLGGTYYAAIEGGRQLVSVDLVENGVATVWCHSCKTERAVAVHCTGGVL